MKASEVMTRKVVSVSPLAPIEEAARLMIAHRVSGLPVTEPSGAVIGMLTEGDLLRRSETGTDRRRSGWLALLIGPGRLARDYVQAHARRVEELMSRAVVSAAPDAPLSEIVALMESRRIKRVPILEQGRLVGIVSRADLLRALARLLPAETRAADAAIGDAEIRRRVLAQIAEQTWAPRACVDVKVAEGVVELRGTFTDARERDALRVLVENTSGVKSLRDSMIWVEPATGMVVDAPPP